LTLTVRVTSRPACDRRGQSLLIRNEDGVVVAAAELAEFDGEANAGELVVKAPLTAGTFSWLAVCPPHAQGDVLYDETLAPFSVTVKPHPTSMIAWDLPSAIVVGERFRFKVGIKCLAGCHLAGRELTVHDPAGTQVGTGRLRDQPWPGTTAMFYDEIDIRAPDAEGQYKWEARASWPETELPHSDSASAFGVRVTSFPDCLVTVEAIDAKEKTPVAGAFVVMHPYRAVTNERGLAELRVRKGEYAILVSKTRFDPMKRTVAISGDFQTQVELVLEAPEQDGSEIYQ
jgi:hypothetical protein